MRNATREGLHFTLASAVLLALALALALLPRPSASRLDARLQQGYPLRVGFALEPPYAFIDDTGALRGESVELLRAALQRMEIGEIRFVRIDFGDLLNELEAGRIDVIAGGMFRTPERVARARFTRPTAAVVAGLLVRRDRQPDEPLRMAVISGSVEAAHAERLVQGAFERIEFADAAQAGTALAEGRVDALALSAPSLRWMLGHRLGQPERFDLQLVESIEPGYPAYALSRGEEAFARGLDSVLSELIGSPWHLEMVEPYGFHRADIAAVLNPDPGP